MLRPQNAPDSLQAVFSQSVVYCGGGTSQNVIHLMHGHRLTGAVQVVPGVFLGGQVRTKKQIEFQNMLNCVGFVLSKGDQVGHAQSNFLNRR